MLGLGRGPIRAGMGNVVSAVAEESTGKSVWGVYLAGRLQWEKF